MYPIGQRLNIPHELFTRNRVTIVAAAGVGPEEDKLISVRAQAQNGMAKGNRWLLCDCVAHIATVWPNESNLKFEDLYDHTESNLQILHD